MRLTQIRNATMAIDTHRQTLLLDPMLAPQGAIVPLKYFTRARRRNPLVALPDNTGQLLQNVQHCLITHCRKGHFDHLDRAGVKWLRQHQVTVHCSTADAGYLKGKGLKVHSYEPGRSAPFLGGQIELVECLHGTGAVGKLMAHGYGFYIQLPDEPSLYICGDTVLTDTIRDFIRRKQPDVIVAPAGGAQFDFGGEIIMGVDEVMALADLALGQVVANHLEALDHCPVSRRELIEAVSRRSWQTRFHVPADGQSLIFNR
ncbi:MBL fold metallo-hydrolase [Shewanella salipaludis]|uniref:MBL fold metallo-hydrolase n=1 Tax=Shewanella salipaludis TaxID=2723052 RepID=A0A972G6P7_9GAMM|nr:MBL fold metallo-hydrolase [Shewanella salipaludis]NMH65505.1 MBL fold metallo-hydrolase [Shewanella salipaludis]